MDVVLLTILLPQTSSSDKARKTKKPNNSVVSGDPYAYACVMNSFLVPNHTNTTLNPFYEIFHKKDSDGRSGRRKEAGRCLYLKTFSAQFTYFSKISCSHQTKTSDLRREGPLPSLGHP